MTQSASDSLRQYKTLFDTARRHPVTIDHHSRMATNNRMFTGVNKGQWKASDSAEAAQADRIRLTLNLIMPNIEHLVGDLMSNPQSIDFLTDLPDKVNDADLVKACFDSDYNMGNYGKAIALAVRDSLIHTGVLQFYPDFKYSNKPRIGVRHISAQNLIIDPFWKTDDIQDCGYVFNAPWLGIEQIRDLCKANKVASEAVERAYERFQSGGVSSEDVPNRDITSEYYDVSSQQFRVVELYRMVQEKVKVLKRTDMKTRKTGEVGMYSDEAVAETNREMAQTSMNHQNSAMYSLIEDTRPVCRVFIFIPGLDNDLLIEDGLYPIQLGRLPFIISSAHNHEGTRQGLVDALVDPQIGLNKRESSASEILDKNARGNLLCEADAFGDNETMEREFRENMNKSGQLLKVAPDALAANKIQPMKSNQPPTELWNAADRMIGFMDRVLGLTAARQGETKSHDTSLLFADQVSQAEIKLFLLNVGVSDMLMQLGDMYFFALKDLYCSGERSMLNPKNGRVVKLNYPEIVDGVPVLRNDIASLPRYVVRVEQAKHGVTVRRRYLALYTELLQRVRNPLLAARYEMEQMRYLGLPDNKVAEMEDDCEVFIKFNKLQMLAQTAQLELQIATANQQLQQVNAPPPAPQGLMGMAAPMQTPPPDAGMGAVPGAQGLAGAMGANQAQ